MKKKKKNGIKDVLKQIPEKDLRKFVSKELGMQEVLNDFMVEFKKYFMEGDSADAYIEQITSAFMDATLDHDYISFHEQSNLLDIVCDAAEAADNFREKGNYEAAIDIYFTILENGIDAVNHSDDSLGYLGSIMREGLQGLQKLTDNKVCTLDEDSRQTFMDRCFDCIDEYNFEGWDWHSDMYRFLISLAKNEEEYDEIMECLNDDKYLKKEYNQEKFLNLKHTLTAKQKSKGK